MVYMGGPFKLAVTITKRFYGCSKTTTNQATGTKKAQRVQSIVCSFKKYTTMHGNWILDTAMHLFYRR